MTVASVFVLLIGCGMFLLGQTIQALSISALIGFLSKRFKLKQRVREKLHLWGAFSI
jgi:hypothetical protein